MTTSKTPNDFTKDLAARLAMHDVLLQQLFTHLLAGNPKAQAQWAATGAAIIEVMGTLPHPQTLVGLEDWQVHWLQDQRTRSQAMAEQFVQKVSHHLAQTGR